MCIYDVYNKELLNERETCSTSTKLSILIDEFRDLELE